MPKAHGELPPVHLLDEVTLWSRLSDPTRVFSYLKPYGRLAHKLKLLPKQRMKRNRFQDPLFGTLPYGMRSLASKAGEYYQAIGDEVSYWKSVYKMDFAPVRLYKSDLNRGTWRLAKKLWKEIWTPVFKRVSRVCTIEEILPTINMNTASGEPMSSVGMKKKRDVLMSEYGCAYLFQAAPYLPLWKVVDKAEWYSAEDIDNDKVRTFIIPPLRFLIHQKMYFNTQNEAMKIHHWSAYGFCPYYGGTDRLARKLIGDGRRVFMMYDVKGWDRLLPVMRTVYRFRSSFFSGVSRSGAEWVGRQSCGSFLLFADGNVVFKNNGNNSGSNNTTTDNILSHECILFYVLLKIFNCDVVKVKSVIAFLFGDDDVCSLPDVDLPDDLEEIVREAFRDFGFELDPFKLSRNLEDMEFLGFSFKCVDGNWLPLYKMDRILAAFCFDFEKMPVPAQLSKAFSLMVMAYPSMSDEYYAMRACYAEYLEHFGGSTDPVVMSYVELGVPRDEQIMAFYMGWENSFDPLFFDERFSLEFSGRLDYVEPMDSIVMEAVGQKNPMANRVNRSDKLLERLVSNEALTESGKAAVIAALDPFHDVEIQDLRGWPDSETAPSVIRRVPFSTTVKSAGDGGAISIMTYPILNNIVTNVAGRVNNVVNPVSGVTTTDSVVGPVVIRSYTAAQILANGYGIRLNETSGVQIPFTMDATYLKGGVRVLGMGIEVSDVTAEIYRQGTLTVTQLDQVGSTDDQTFMIDTYTNSASASIVCRTPFTGRTLQDQCHDLATATQFPGYVQWATSKGCYVVVPFTGEDNCMRRGELINPVSFGVSNNSSDDYTTPGVANTTTVWCGAPNSQPVALTPLFVENYRNWAPMHSKQIILSGLNVNSTFTINCVIYLEQFPLFDNPSMISLARPSAPLDELALEIISRSTKDLPIAVPVGMNPRGEWFAEVVATSLEALGPLASAFFPEFSPLIMAGSSGAAKGIRKLGAPKKATLVKQPNYGPPPPLPPRPARSNAPPPLPDRDREYIRAARRVRRQQKKARKAAAAGKQQSKR